MPAIYGIQKLTLLDFPGKTACTVFTGGCNFRCPFCHNADLVLTTRQPSLWDEQQLLDFLAKRRGLLDGVCVTGGEPLLQQDLENLMTEIHQMGFAVKLDTNGSFPERLRHLVERGLVDYVAMDIKNAPKRYAETVGLPAIDLSPICESIAFLLSGAVPYEFRTTVVQELHTAREILAIGDWIKGADAYFLQGFVDSGRLLSDGLHAVPKDEMERFQALLQNTVPHTQLRGI